MRNEVGERERERERGGFPAGICFIEIATVDCIEDA